MIQLNERRVEHAKARVSEKKTEEGEGDGGQVDIPSLPSPRVFLLSPLSFLAVPLWPPFLSFIFYSNYG